MSRTRVRNVESFSSIRAYDRVRNAHHIPLVMVVNAPAPRNTPSRTSEKIEEDPRGDLSILFPSYLIALICTTSHIYGCRESNYFLKTDKRVRRDGRGSGILTRAPSTGSYIIRSSETRGSTVCIETVRT